MFIYYGQDWTDDFTGLWQTQNWDFVKERAFNTVAAEGSTRCCVCSLFDSPSPFSTFQPQFVSDLYEKLLKKKQHNGNALTVSRNKMQSFLPKSDIELRVVVQRVLINLPNTMRTRETVETCVTDSDHSDGTSDDLITCSSCAICVHRCESLSLVLL